MWLCSKKAKAEYDLELLKQKDPYSYYIGYAEQSNIDSTDEGEQECIPFICMNREDVKLVSEDEAYRTYECDDYYVFESTKGYSSLEEKAELVTNAKKFNADLIYSDVDNITCDGKREKPFYKPCFDIDTSEYFDYFLDFYAVKKMKSKIDIRLLDKISHVTKPLFHYTFNNNRKNINEEYQIKHASYLTDEFYLLSRELSEDKNVVSVIIPSKDNPGLVKRVIEGIRKAKVKSGINALEVVLVDNGSNDENKHIITGVIENNREKDKGLSIKYLYEPMEFNFSAMCNLGAENAEGQYLLFLNDDIEITDELFILKLLFFARMDHAGAVGCKLLYPGDERRIQHVGITCLKYAGPSHKLSTFPDDQTLYFGRNRGVHNCLAVTAACLMVSAEKFFKIGGFYDKMKVGYNDVDLCISLYEAGLKNIVNNECILVHHESISRGADALSEKKLNRLDEERGLLYERHPWVLTEGDPYYNPNLAEDFLDYRVNVIPEFERRDYVSVNEKNLEQAANKLENKLGCNVDANAEGALFASKNMFFNIERISRVRGYLEISGWSLVNKKHNYMFDRYVTVTDSEGRVRVYDAADVRREDLQDVFPEASCTELSGVFSRIKIAELGDDTFIPERFGILMINKQTGKKYYAGFRKSDI